MQQDLIELSESIRRLFELEPTAFKRRRTALAVEAREVFAGLARSRAKAHPREIAEVLGCDRTGVIHMTRRWDARVKRDPNLVQTYERLLKQQEERT